MKIKIKILITFLLSVLLALSCNKDTTKQNIQASEYFPNSIGDYWEYDVYDSSAVRDHPDFPREYTVKVSITGIAKLIDNQNAYVWRYEFPWGNDIKYIRIENDTVKIYDTTRTQTIRGLQFPLKIYLIPFQNEERWDGKLLLIDSSHVYSASIVNTSSKTFTDCFKIYHYYLAPNIEYIDNYWFKPNVGMIKMHYDDYNFAPRNKYMWEVKKFYLH